MSKTLTRALGHDAAVDEASPPQIRDDLSSDRLLLPPFFSATPTGPHCIIPLAVASGHGLDAVALHGSQQWHPSSQPAEPDDHADDGEEGTFASPLLHSKAPIAVTRFLTFSCHSVNSFADDDSTDTGPVVRRPQPNAPRTKSKLRVSFNPGEEDGSASGAGTGASTPAEGSSGKPSSKDILSRRERDRGQESQIESRTYYSKAYLNEPRNSTPSTPRDISPPCQPPLMSSSPLPPT